MRWLCCLTVLGVMAQGVWAQTLPTDAELSAAVFQQINTVRQTNNLPALTYNDDLASLALAHAQSMAASGKLSHDGFSDRFDAAKGKIPGLKAFGENVAMNFPRADIVEDTIKNWMNSPVHRANILRGNTLTGVGVARAANGTYYFTQIFGKSG